jgi:hypothetical protein
MANAPRPSKRSERTPVERSERRATSPDQGGLLERRLAAAAHNDAVIRELRRKAWQSSIKRKALEVTGRQVPAEPESHRHFHVPDTPVELKCECGDTGCEAKIHVNGLSYEARGIRFITCCAPRVTNRLSWNA